MTPSGLSNRLRLVPAEGQRVPLAGFVVASAGIASLARRLVRRAEHYPALRVAVSRDRLIFWSTDETVPLPWADIEPVYLTQLDKTLFFPARQRPNLPERWLQPLATRLAQERKLSLPILLMNDGEKLEALGLGLNSCAVSAVDWEELTGDQY